jgi:hypothetical protein
MLSEDNFEVPTAVPTPAGPIKLSVTAAVPSNATSKMSVIAADEEEEKPRREMILLDYRLLLLLLLKL